MHARGRSLRPPLAALALASLAVAAGAADRTVLAIGAHAGDAEITTGALLARHKRLGDRVVMLHLTLGEAGNPKMTEDLATWKAAATSYEFIRGGISSFPYLEYYEALARLRGAVAGKRFAVALEVDPFAKKRVLDSLP